MEEEDKEITVVEIFNNGKEYLTELKRNKILCAVIVITFLFLGIVASVISTPNYVASSTMMLENSKGGSISGALALASQFGLLNGGGSGPAMNEDKLLEIIKAETIVKAALFHETTIDGRTDFLANHFIDLFGYKEKWASDTTFRDFKFKHKKEDLTLKENRVFKMFYGRIISKFLKIEKSKNGIVSITVTTTSEQFSKYFNDQLVKSVINFYVDRITEKTRKNVSIVQNRVDSIANALRDSELALARWKDASHQLVKVQGMITEIKLRRNVEVNNSMYIEGVKQLEISKFTLLEQTPFLQIIDEPILPLNSIGKISLVGGGIIGGTIGVLLAGLYIWIRKKILEIKRHIISPNN